MTLTPEQARAIATGRQSTLRLPVKPGRAMTSRQTQPRNPDAPPTGAPVTACPWRPEREYAIARPLNDLERMQIRNGDLAPFPPIGHVRVASAVREPLHITPQQAKAEGYRSVAYFQRAWVRRHDRLWIDHHPIDFEWARYTGQGTVSWILLERYRRRWEGREVWVIQFEIVADVRYLAQPDPVKAQGDYTRTPSRSIDPLPVVEAAVVEQYAKDALAFCIGRQMQRAKEQAEKRDARARQFRHAA